MTASNATSTTPATHDSVTPGVPYPTSVEFFPAKTPEGADKLRAVRQQLYALGPQFCSVTYGAGGSTQEGTFAAVRDILAEGQSAASHFSCIGATRDSVRAELAQLQAMGVQRLVALRGGLPAAFTSRWRPTPKSIRRRARPRPTCRLLPPRCARVRIRPSRSIFSTPMPTSGLWMTPSAWDYRCPSCRASCPFWAPRS